ncbi:hypothetical protein OPQ81_005124 [Rhizoctonia solani]|nr:hypothetical protein OPQ81_005124 [Rhizoctonia solani]
MSCISRDPCSCYHCTSFTLPRSPISWTTKQGHLEISAWRFIPYTPCESNSGSDNMSKLSSLPTESIVYILRLLPPADIRTCKLVSRQLLATIQESLELQYLLELDFLGYVHPLNPLDKLSFGDKVRLLQEKHLINADGTQRHIGVRTAKFEPIGPMSANIRYSRGVLAVGKPSIDVTRQLQVYRFASSNKSTEHCSFLLKNIGVEAHDFRFEPDLDLLVLLESVTSPTDDTDLEMRFHLRSLSTGLAHPLALNPVLMNTFKFTTTYNDTGFQIVGQLLVILYFTNSRLDASSPKMCIWDWTTGERVAWAEVPGTDFAFVSADTFVVMFSRRKWSGSDAIGSLEVYSIADIAPGGCARHVASLHLPPTTEGPCHSSCQFIKNPSPPVPLIVNGRPKVITPQRIYEIGSDLHHLCLHIKAFNIKNIPTEMANGLLFIPFSNIHRVLKEITANQSESRMHILWEDWGCGASWVNTRQLRRGATCIFGHRAALLSFDRKERGWRVFVYDLRANARGRTMDAFLGDGRAELWPSDQYLNAVFNNPELGAVREPRVIASFMVSENEEWNEHTDSNPPELAIDDERIVTYDERRLRGSPMLNIYDI